MKKKWYLGDTKKQYYGMKEKFYLEDFEWACGWYWSGGWVSNRYTHTHFDNCFLDSPDSRGHSLGRFFDPWTKRGQKLKKDERKILGNGAAIWEDLDFFLDNAQYTSKEWWRLKDLFKQFYALKDSAEVFRHGGHCSDWKRTEKELNEDMAKRINKHIEEVIIPEIRKVLNFELREGEKK